MPSIKHTTPIPSPIENTLTPRVSLPKIKSQASVHVDHHDISAVCSDLVVTPTQRNIFIILFYLFLMILMIY